MSTIAVIGGTGFAGATIVTEALTRGHAVKTLSRTASTIDGVQASAGSALDPAAVAAVIAGSDVVVGALSPRGELTGRIGEAYALVVDAAAAAGVPFVIVGGFGSLRPAPGAPRIVEGDDFPAEYRAESQELAALLPVLADSAVDWVFVSPAANFGAHDPGVATGSYQLGGEVADFSHGPTAISGADFAKGIVDIIESGDHHRVHVSLY